MDEAIRFQTADLTDMDRAVAANASQVVAKEIDNHNILGAVFLAMKQFSHPCSVLFRVGAARPCSLDGSSFDLTLLNTEKPLRRCTDNSEVAHVEVRGKGSGVTLPQPKIEFHRPLLGGI